MAKPKRATPWLSRRGDPTNGVFYAFWYDAAKRKVERISLGTTYSAEAEIKFAEFLLNSREIRIPTPLGALTVFQALDDYLIEHVEEKCADAGVRRQRGIVVHLKAFFGDSPLEQVNVKLSRQYRDARLAGRIGGGKRRKNKRATLPTVRRELNCLVAAANHAIWMERTTRGWVCNVDLPPEKKLGPDDEAPYYTQEELDRIFEETKQDDPELGVFVRMLYHTGARRGSIERLTRSQVKLRERNIILQPPGKRSTKKRQPIVPILRSMEEDVNAMLALNEGETLFSRPDYYRYYKSLVMRAGIDEKRAHPHIMRHTRATHLLQAGKDLYDVAALLGDTPATISRVYGHHRADKLAAKLED